MKQFKLNLELHQRTMKQLQKELISSAEVWAKELEERSKKIQELGEEELKQEVAEESVVSDDWDKAVHSIRNRVVLVEQMVTSQLVGLVRTVSG